MTQPVVIGNAELWHGDCLEILPTLPKVDAVVTDPPYGVEFAEWDDAIPDWLPLARKAAERVVFTTAPTTIWSYPRADWVCAWARPGSPARTSQGGFNHWTPVLVYGSVKFPKDMLYLPPVANLQCREYPPGYGHPCPKPVDVMRWMVSACSAAEQTILDPFMGSGTTGVACMNLGRKFIGIELERRYFDIACERIENAQRQARMFA
jgi:site-specific DNA-methyltransferase (adenine-specific)